MLAAEVPSVPLAEFMEDYREAVFNHDVEDLVARYAFPLTFHDGARTVVINDADAAEHAFETLRTFYDDLGMVTLETRYMASHRVAPSLVLIDVVWRLRDEASLTICDQRSTYALREDARQAKIVAVFLHEDIVPAAGHA
jgi:hypothetical protein